MCPSANYGKDLMSRVLDLDNLYVAWKEVQENRGAAGGDLVTLVRFGSRLELNLLHLAERVQTGNYQPGKVRLVTIFTGRKEREIAIWCVADRVLQRAVMQVIEPLFERMFLPCSFGYRKHRSVADAVRRIIVLRDGGYNWVVDADILNCFPSLSHGMLISLLRRRIMDQDILDLIATWLPYGRPRAARRSQESLGISLGAVISPLLCNVCLHELDKVLRGEHLQSVRYADDFVVLCLNSAERDSALDTIQTTLRSLTLEINTKKTRLTSFKEGFTFLGVTFKDRKYSYDWYNKRVEASDMGETFPLGVDGYR